MNRNEQLIKITAEVTEDPVVQIKYAEHFPDGDFDFFMILQKTAVTVTFHGRTTVIDMEALDQ